MDFKNFTPREINIIRYLTDGGKHSAIDIAIKLHIGDARSHIRDLRRKGVYVSDEWVRTADNHGQYKRYWINPEQFK